MLCGHSLSQLLIHLINVVHRGKVLALEYLRHLSLYLRLVPLIELALINNLRVITRIHS